MYEGEKPQSKPVSHVTRDVEVEPDSLEARVIAALKTCYDPEIPVDIYELGLIYAIEFAEDDHLTIRMTLTSPMCPVAEILPGQIEQTARTVEGVKDVLIDLVWEPPWEPTMMSAGAKLQLGF